MNENIRKRLGRIGIAAGAVGIVMAIIWLAFGRAIRERFYVAA